MTKILAASLEVTIEKGGNPAWNFRDLGPFISILLQAAIIVAGLGTFAFLVMAGLQYITSGGEKAQMEAARGKITSAILGLTIVSAAYVLTRILETAFGIAIVSGIKWPHP